jgi:hypothetical protein
MPAEEKSMSRRQRRQRQGRSFPWVLLAFGGILILAAIVLFATLGGGTDGGTPAIVVDQSRIDYGYVKFGEDRAFRIQVTNGGTGVLRFKEKPYIEIVEGC